MSDPFDLSESGARPPAAADAPYLSGLNQWQREAVETTDGALLVLAGAGTGKTRVLTTRLAHILIQGKAWPKQILAVTFTNKAAREMRERVAALLGHEVEGWWVGTFHALGARILRRHAEAVGLQPNFTILDDDDQIRLIKQLLEARGLDDKKNPARTVLSVIQRWKDRGLPPAKVSGAEGSDACDGRALTIYGEYQARLKALNAADFGDLLLHCLTLFQNNPEILDNYRRQFRYVMVDEYQDTNVAQYLWLRLLAGGEGNICCVGDDDQCVPAGTRITMADGSVRSVEDIRAGDEVLSSIGAGEFRPARVSDVFKRRADREVIRVATAGGRTLITTAEHTHLADIVHNESPQKYFTYLMFKKGRGYRLGTSQIYTKAVRKPVIGFRQRCLQEHADAVWLLDAFDSENDAREREHRLSLQYGITTLPFVARKGGSRNGLVHDQERLDRIHADLDSIAKGERLLADYRLDPGMPHHVPQSANGRRKTLYITLNAERRGPTPMHRIALSGSDAGEKETVRALGLNPRVYKRNPDNWRFETAFRDFAKVDEIRKRLETVFDLTVVRKAQVFPGRRALAMRPASQLRPGMVVVDEEGTPDVITTVEWEPYAGTVHDLNVEGSHNYIANGLVTHNSIYSWRGAEVGNILRFEKDFPGAHVIRLERNYRSTPHILGAASGLIANNDGRLGKTLWTEGDAGEKVSIKGVWDGEEEARFIGEEIEALQSRGHSLNEMAILVRAGFQTREFEERLITLGLPYRVIGGQRFYERQEIRDAIAYLRVVAQPDDDLAFERIVNLPKRGLGQATLQTLHVMSRSAGLSLVRAAEQVVATDELKPRARNSLGRLLADFERWRGLAETVEHGELTAQVLDESGYTDMWRTSRAPEAPGRLENLKEMVAAMSEFENLGGFLEHVSLVMDNEESMADEKVSLMTLHGAKGLEFESVFLPGWEEGLFPHQRALDEGGTGGLEEERRLAYVGLTRARQRAFVSFAANRRVYGQWQSAIPSRFIDELPPDHVEQASASGLYGGRGMGMGGDGYGESRFGGSGFGGSGAGGGGWQRRRSAAPLIEDTEWHRENTAEAASKFSVGQRVFHQKFGYGKIVAVDGNKLAINFEHSGVKKVIDSFVE